MVDDAASTGTNAVRGDMTEDILLYMTWRAMADIAGCIGLWHYEKAGYEAKAKHFNNKAFTRDLTGQHVLITGANQGIGQGLLTKLVAMVHSYLKKRPPKPLIASSPWPGHSSPGCSS